MGTLRHSLAPNTTLDGYIEFGVHRRKCGEYIITGEDFLQNKCLVYRWMPEGPNLGFERPAIWPMAWKGQPGRRRMDLRGGLGAVRSRQPGGRPLRGRRGPARRYLRDGGWFYQAIPLDAAGCCAVSFKLAGDSRQGVEVQVDNRPIGAFTPTQGGYVECATVPVPVREGGHVVKFVATGHGTALVDDVKIIRQAPPEPAGAAATVEEGRVVLFWNPTPGATGYTVYRTEAAQGRFEAVASQLATTVYADSQVQAGRMYCYRVAAVNSGGESPKTPVLTAVLPEPKAKPRRSTPARNR